MRSNTSLQPTDDSVGPLPRAFTAERQYRLANEMTLPEFRTALVQIRPPTAEDAKLLDLLVGRLEAWAADSATAETLLADLNRILGNVWFSTTEIHTAVFDALEAFAKQVHGIEGMTVNERLFTFGLFDAWDSGTESTRQGLRFKLGAAA